MILSMYFFTFLYIPPCITNITFLSKFSAISVQPDIPIRLKGQISERTSELRFVIQLGIEIAIQFEAQD